MIIAFLGSSPWSLSVGYWLIRVGVGSLFVVHGSQKLLGGTGQWQWLGSQMAHIGITSYPLFWGLLATLAELVGGLLLIMGLMTRLGALAIIAVMGVALVMHWKKGDGFAVYSHVLLVIVIMLGILVAGSGERSIDSHLAKQALGRG